MRTACDRRRALRLACTMLGTLVCAAVQGADTSECRSIPAGLSGRIEIRQESGAAVHVLVLLPRSAQTAAELLAACSEEALEPTEVQLQPTGVAVDELAGSEGSTVHVAGSLHLARGRPGDMLPVQFDVSELIRPR